MRDNQPTNIGFPWNLCNWLVTGVSYIVSPFVNGFIHKMETY